MAVINYVAAELGYLMKKLIDREIRSRIDHSLMSLV